VHPSEVSDVDELLYLRPNNLTILERKQQRTAAYSKTSVAFFSLAIY